MESLGAGRKRGRPDAANGNGGLAGSKRTKELDSVGSKSKPCTKFFSTAGCPFGEGCHFLHYVPGGYNQVAQMSMGNPAVAPPSRRGPVGPPHIADNHGHGQGHGHGHGHGQGPPPVKSKMCNKYNTAEGCKFGDKCHFAHGERELGKPILPSHDDGHMAFPPPSMMGPGRMGGVGMEPPPAAVPATASFGATATAKISVDASLAGAIIGKGGANTKHICRATGAKLAIRDHESDANLRNIELEGSFDQINQASKMVSELIVTISASSAPAPMKAAPPAAASYHQPAANNFKTKLCDNFAKGKCTFGDRCHFAHGANELRKAAAV